MGMSVSASDADLVRAARAGDRPSLGVLLERHRAALYASAAAMLGPGARRTMPCKRRA
jgi:hypothetical protein